MREPEPTARYSGGIDRLAVPSMEEEDGGGC